MSGESWRVDLNDVFARDSFVSFITEQCAKRTITYTIKKEGGGRTISQNALFWMWCNDLAKHFFKVEKVTEQQKQDIHDILCHKFLGYETKKINSTEIHSLRTLTWPKKLSIGEQSDMLDKINAWAIEHGCMLPIPDNSEYADLQKSQVA